MNHAEEPGTGRAVSSVEHLEQSVSAQQIESIGEVDEGNNGFFCSRHFLCSCINEKIMSVVDLCPKAALRLGVDSVGEFLESVEDDTCEELTCDAQEGDATVVIAVTPVTLVLIQGDNIGVSCLVALLL